MVDSSYVNGFKVACKRRYPIADSQMRKVVWINKLGNKIPNMGNKRQYEINKICRYKQAYRHAFRKIRVL